MHLTVVDSVGETELGAGAFACEHARRLGPRLRSFCLNARAPHTSVAPPATLSELVRSDSEFGGC